MASDNNIFEILQKVAENNSSSKKLTDILTENGYKGTLEDAGREIQQAEQVILENLTSDDLKNIAGGKSLMNKKVKQIIAISGASLMAGPAIVPIQATTNPKQSQKENQIIKYVKENPIHSATTGFMTAATVAMAALSAVLKYKLNTEKPLDVEELKKFLNDIPAGQDILTLLPLKLTDGSANEIIKLTAYKGTKGETPGLGTKPDKTFIQVENGEGESGGLCAEEHIMAGLQGKKVKLTNLANYLAFKAGGPQKLTVLPDKISDSRLFQEVNQDADLKTYDRKYLNTTGNLLAEVVEKSLFEALTPVNAAIEEVSNVNSN